MRGDVTGLRRTSTYPDGRNPGTGLNNLFVMNINSGKLIRIAVRDRHCESRSKHEAKKEPGQGEEREGRGNARACNSMSPPVPMRVTMFILYMPFSISPSFRPSSSFSRSPQHSHLPLLSELAGVLSPPRYRGRIAQGFQSPYFSLTLSRLPFTFRDLARVIGMPEARRRALVTDIGRG